jgi:hypothetical protein
MVVVNCNVQYPPKKSECDFFFENHLAADKTSKYRHQKKQYYAESEMHVFSNVITSASASVIVSVIFLVLILINKYLAPLQFTFNIS